MQSAFHQHAQRTAFRRRDVRLQSRLCARKNPMGRDAPPTPSGFAEIYRSAEGNLTASSVMAVMPACTLTMPNPGSRNEWPPHWDVGIHCVWPCKLGTELALVIVFAIAAQI